jgi:drug/metabolite transporter (DMT)-like permease
MPRRAIFYALVSAGLFGVSTPAAKVLLGTIDPAVLAGLLYCGAGIGIGLLRRLTPRLFSPANAQQASLQRKDVPWLTAAIAAGGVVGPLLMMFWSLPNRRGDGFSAAFAGRCRDCSPGLVRLP